MSRSILLAFVFLAALSITSTQAGTTTGFAFLDLPAGARVAALGGAGATFADGFGLAKTAAPGLRLGGALQWTHEDLGGDGASAFALSAGGLYALPSIKGLTLGASIRNLGGSPSFKASDGSDGASVSQPMT